MSKLSDKRAKHHAAAGRRDHGWRRAANLGEHCAMPAAAPRCSI